jgi:hypothetical protein
MLFAIILFVPSNRQNHRIILSEVGGRLQRGPTQAQASGSQEELPGQVCGLKPNIIGNPRLQTDLPRYWSTRRSCRDRRIGRTDRRGIIEN